MTSTETKQEIVYTNPLTKYDNDQYIIIVADNEGYCYDTSYDDAYGAAMDIYGALTWVHVRLFKVPLSALKDDWRGQHYSSVLDDQDLDIDDFLLEEFDGHIDESEPECEDSEHFKCEWEMDQIGCKENPGVIGHGGGVKIYEHCSNCTRTKVLNTWAQHPETGQQGFEVTSYGHRND